MKELSPRLAFIIIVCYCETHTFTRREYMSDCKKCRRPFGRGVIRQEVPTCEEGALYLDVCTSCCNDLSAEEIAEVGFAQLDRCHDKDATDLWERSAYLEGRWFIGEYAKFLKGERELPPSHPNPQIRA